MHLPWATPGSGLHETTCRVWQLGSGVLERHIGTYALITFRFFALHSRVTESLQRSSAALFSIPYLFTKSLPPSPKTFTPLRFTQKTSVSR